MVADGRRDPAAPAGSHRAGGALAWRAWRSAAWFAVGASCTVLIVLAFAAARLTGAPADAGNAFPGLPTGGLLTAQPPESQTQGHRPPSTSGDGGDPLEPGATDGGTGQVQHGPPDDATTAGHSGAPGGAAAAGTGGPSVTYLPPDDPPAGQAQAVVDTTVQFYDRLARDVDSAWGLVGARVKVHGLESFRKQWAGIAAARVQEVVVDAGAETVLATVALTGTDGRAQVRQYRLEFRRGDPGVVQDVAPVGGNGQKPAK
jgi:hypothetical protein